MIVSPSSVDVGPAKTTASQKFSDENEIYQWYKIKKLAQFLAEQKSDEIALTFTQQLTLFNVDKSMLSLILMDEPITHLSWNQYLLNGLARRRPQSK